VKYKEGINFLKLTLARKTVFNSLGHAALDLVITVIIKLNTKLTEKI